MVAMPLPRLGQQTAAIVKKNLLYLVVRNWFPTLLQATIIPVLILALTLNIKNYSRPNLRPNAAPSPIPSLRDSIPGDRQFFIITPPNVPSDIDDVVQKITSQLSDIPNQIQLITSSTDDTPEQCLTTVHGISKCHAVLRFNDSPGSQPDNNGTWNYTITIDYARRYYGDSISGVQLPLQLAIDQAITGASETPMQYTFDDSTYEQKLARRRAAEATDIGGTYAIVFFLAYLPIIYHIANTVTSDRASGMSTLIDAMGGSPTARVMASTFTFGLLYLPFWIIAGVLYWYIIFPETNAAIPLFWQILSGWAMTNSTIFAASFFKGSRISSVFVAGSFLALAGGAAILLGRYWIPLSNVTAIPLALFFPSMNILFTLFHFTRFQAVEKMVDMSTGQVKMPSITDQERFDVSTSMFWGLLVIQIFLYPVLAVLAESFLHGINTKDRKLTGDGQAATMVAVEVRGLTKVYSTTWWKKILLFWRGTPQLTALDGLNLVAQKRQILCLLGVNGAGKSTTMDLLSGFVRQTSGTIQISGSGSSPLGICPQKNVMINELTVLDHVRFWSAVKSGQVLDAEVEDIIAKCGLEEKKHSRAGKLSGGQKRKLQLACMFVGGSLVCLMDEVTTGLDPLSRRTIWDIILAERAKRSIIFTTHFLDEGDVLADHIVLLSKGQIKCQGSGAELKTRFGGGYRVHIPQTDLDPIEDDLGLSSPTVHQDRLVYRVADSQSAAKLVSHLEMAGHRGVQMAGPTIEDVFLNLTQDPTEEQEATRTTTEIDLSKGLSSGHRTSFWQQVAFLLRKRITILPRYWMSTLLALVLPIACVPAIYTFIDFDFTRPTCNSTPFRNTAEVLHWKGSYVHYCPYTEGSQDPASCYDAGSNTFGPPSVNESLFNVLSNYPVGRPSQYDPGFNISQYDQSIHWVSGIEEFKSYIQMNNNTLYEGGLWVGDEHSTPLIASYAGITPTTQALLNIWSQVKAKMPIAAIYQTMNAMYYEVRPLSGH